MLHARYFENGGLGVGCVSIIYKQENKDIINYIAFFTVDFILLLLIGTALESSFHYYIALSHVPAHCHSACQLYEAALLDLPIKVYYLHKATKSVHKKLASSSSSLPSFIIPYRVFIYPQRLLLMTLLLLEFIF